MNKTPDEVANEVIMTRQVCESLIILVEGYNDEKTYTKFLAASDSETISSWGKENVLAAISILENEELLGILGIVDADFWHIDGHSPISVNVIVTDYHDLEMMMIGSNSFSYFLNEVASKHKIIQILNVYKVDDLRDILFQKALPLACLRRYSLKNGLDLNFNELKFNKFINRENFELDLEKMIEIVLSCSKNPALSLENMIYQIRKMINSITDDPYQMCCGHDVIAILGVGLRKCIGGRLKETASLEILESELRMCYDSDCFRKTQLYRDAVEWSQNNPKYQVFI